MSVVGASDWASFAAACGSVIGLGLSLAFATHSVAYLSKVFVHFVDDWK